MSSVPAVEVRDVNFGYHTGSDIFCGFTWIVGSREWWAVVGPSGCGKTTLLHLLAGLRQPSRGQLLVQGEPVCRPRSSTGLILQDFGLLPWARAAENVELGLRIRGIRPAERRERVDYWLHHLGIYDLRNHYPSQLSGGQRQRVAIARTIALDPDLLLMDEPFGSLDAFTREGLQNLVASLGEERERTSIIVTHDIEEAVFLGTHILVLTGHPIRHGLVVANPGARQPGYREDPQFFHLVREVRLLVQRTQATAFSEGTAETLRTGGAS